MASLTWQKSLPYVLIVGSIVGLLASFALTYDKIHVLQDASYQPGCNLNPILSCGSVMKTAQANLLGVPNTLFGLMAFSMCALFGVVLLAGAELRRWLWQGAQIAATGGVIFMHYLFFQSVFRIHAICPWCFTVWMVTIALFFCITQHNIRMGFLPGSHSPVAQFITRYSTDLLILWYLCIFAILVVKFWYYWSSLL